MSYETAVAELEKTVQRLGRDQEDLAESVRQFERGLALAKRCSGAGAGPVSLLFGNPYFVIPLVAWAIAQASKVIVDSVLMHRLSVRRLGTAGGMPSSHSALVVSLTTVIGRLQGVDSPLFAIALIFSTVVMYDATGVRRAAGQQAMILNRLLDDIFAHQGFRQERLRELIGHTPIEVVAGALLGFVLGIGWHLR